MSEATAIGQPTLRLRSVAPAQAPSRAGERLAVVTAGVALAMMPLLNPGGPSGVAPVDLLIALAIGAAMLWAGTTGQMWRFAYLAPMALFIGGGAIGALRGPVPGTSAIALVQDLILLFWCWALMNVASVPERLGTLLRAWAYSSIGWALVLFAGLATGMKALTGQTAAEGVRTSITFHSPNIAGNYFFISLMVIWATQCPRRRPQRLAAYGLMVAAIFTTGSSGALLSLAAGVGVAGLFGLYRRSGLVPAISAAALGAVAIFALHSNVSMRSIQSAAANSRWAFVRDGLGRGEQSVEARGAILRETTELYKGSGALGAGPVSTKVRMQRAQAPIAKEAHDDYLAALLERGVVGFAGLLLLIGGLAVRSFSFSTGQLSRGFDRVVAKPHALAGAVAGTFAAAGVYEVLHLRHVWALFAFVAALSFWGRRE
jgi:O-Antigen ligase